MKTATTRHARAIHATRAVTLGGLAFSAAACGTDPESPRDVGPTDIGTDTSEDTTIPDVGVDTQPDVAVDTQPDISIDTGHDTGPACSAEAEDGVCPAGCTTDDDVDCCLDQNDDQGWEWCEWYPEWGCSCAVEGPFAPPSFR